ncbi:MAG: Asp-tRNA(Asn)/Glu-tRNA(Gln) amidotransferase subunit GatC [Candidatus Nealsonbacteria bacterium]|nr:Asp-tRNA(Asn)/Glu-tRNA(Gln) amidotransferase subunit GatC [Candidatus Nealsonbacteria bacterium]
MLSKEETEHIAGLARLGLGEEEIERYQKDLSSILDYIEKLKEVDTGDIKPFTHPVEISKAHQAYARSKGRLFES